MKEAKAHGGDSGYRNKCGVDVCLRRQINSIFNGRT